MNNNAVRISLTPLARLDHMLKTGNAVGVKDAYKVLLGQCRNEKGPAPEWDRYPEARDYFLQRN
jgi:hypothetical protein